MESSNHLASINDSSGPESGKSGPGQESSLSSPQRIRFAVGLGNQKLYVSNQKVINHWWKHDYSSDLPWFTMIYLLKMVIFHRKVRLPKDNIHLRSIPRAITMARKAPVSHATRPPSPRERRMPCSKARFRAASFNIWAYQSWDPTWWTSCDV